MTPPARTRPSRRLAAPLALLVGAVLALLGTAGPAAAHDSLTGSSPAADASIEQAPEAIVLDYSAELIDAGTEVLVADAAGTTVSTGTPAVVGTQVTQALEPQLPAGAYTVTWRVVSSDGHPIDGAFGFTVTVGAPAATDTPAPTESPEAAETTEASASPDPEAGADDPADTEEQVEEGLNPAVVTIAAISILAIAAIAITLAVIRKRRG